MDVFGPQWEDHAARAAANWDAVVGENDIVLMPGDHSWAMRLDDALPDLAFIAKRPGKKVMIRGNHDYWWSRQATNKIQGMVDPSITLLQGKSVVLDGAAIGGTRGWRLEDYGPERSEAADAKVFARELSYLERALVMMPQDAGVKIAMLHYPPFTVDGHPNEFAEMLRRFGVDILVYGHIHGRSVAWLEGDVDGTAYHLVAADHIDFTPKLILE
jgi:predicted phosphohydrolase